MPGKNNPYIGQNERKMFRREQFIQGFLDDSDPVERLLEKVRQCNNTVIFGPKGSGKSALLSCALNRETRRELAEDHILVSRFTFPISLTEKEAIFGSLADAVLKCADELKSLDPEAYDRIQDAAKKSLATSSNKESYLQGLCGILNDEEYEPVLVVDQFENFVNSSHVVVAHHDILRECLMSGNLHMIVATDYDFEDSSLPPNVKGSYLLQCFTASLELKPLTIEGCGALLHSISGQDDFNEDELEMIFYISGGIPVLVRRCAYYAWEKKQVGPLEHFEWQMILKEMAKDETVTRLISRWLLCLDPMEAQLLRDLTAEGDTLNEVGEDYKKAAARMERRGLLCPTEERGYWEENSLVFRDYCRLHPPTASKLDLAKDPDVRGPQVVHYHNEVIQQVTGDLVNEGGTKHVEEKNMTMNMVNYGFDAKQLLHTVLTCGAPETLAMELQKQLGLAMGPEGGLVVPRKEGMTDEQYDIVYDAEFQEKITDKLVGESGKDTYREIEKDELLTLDKQFAAARQACREDLTDERIATLSDRASFYLKLAVVVENALSIMKKFPVSDIDCSAQIVLYGKAMEQQLRDRIHPLFLADDVLCETEVFQPDGTYLPMYEVNVGLTSMGAYAHCINHQAAKLASLCAEQQMSHLGAAFTEQQWKHAWTNAKELIHRVREIRNKADHANHEYVSFQDVDKLVQRAFTGEVCAIHYCEIARELKQRLGH